MNVLSRLRNRSPRPTAGNPASAKASSPPDARLPVSDYDELDIKQLKRQLSALSQVDLAAIESHELSHQARVDVLSRLRWLQGSEPLPGYDALPTEEVVRALTEADGETVRAVREYERRHRDRLEIRDAVARVLPTASASEGEDRVREEQAARVREGLAGRDETASGLSDR